MEKLGNVQQKIHCVFETRVVEEPSGKRSHQAYKVVAGENIRPEAEESGISDAVPTEKLDGTCVFVDNFEGMPWLWARHDRKPNKNADRRFKKFQNTHRGWIANGKNGPEPHFSWNLNSDLKDIPGYWVPAKGVAMNDEGTPMPDENGHIPGWVPIDPKGRQHCWHAGSVDIDAGLALVLQTSEEENCVLEITAVPLAQLLGSTLELIGTNINANPYRLGTKQAPLHVLVRHGAITFRNHPPLDFSHLRSWFDDDKDGQVEGVVWHCDGGTKLFKIHRHHLDLKWPLKAKTPRLLTWPVKVNVDVSKYSDNLDLNTVFGLLGGLRGVQFDSMIHIPLNAVLYEARPNENE